VDLPSPRKALTYLTPLPPPSRQFLTPDLTAPGRKQSSSRRWQNGAVRYIVVGAGAIGATLGGRLADSGHDVVLVARGEHAAALRAGGLRLSLPGRVIHHRLPVESIDQLRLQAEDVLILAVKSQQSEAVLTQLAARAAQSTTSGEFLPVVCAQNGISNEDAALRLFARVHGICLHLPATHLEPGQVDAFGDPYSGVLQLGSYPGGLDDTDRQLATDLSGSGFVTTLREDVMAWKRAKLLRNLANALEVLWPAGDGDEGQADDRTGVARRAAQEGAACFAAAGLSVTSAEEYNADIAQHAQPAPIADRARSGGSTWQSIQRGLGDVETDYLNGEIVRLGRLRGVPTPVNETIQQLMRALLAGRLDLDATPPPRLLTAAAFG
jgi:2-dehydropantoate 2-reductase